MSTAIKTATKADLQQQLDVATSTIEELRQQLADLTEAQARRRDHLEQVVWLQRDEPTEEQRTPTAGGVPCLRFAAQYAGLDRRTGRRNFGAYKDFIAYGELAETLDAIFASGTRLVAITAYERPWANTARARRSDWVVTSVTSIGRPTEPAEESAPAAPEPTGYGEPTEEEVLF